MTNPVGENKQVSEDLIPVKGEGFQQGGGFEFIHIGKDKVPAQEIVTLWKRRHSPSVGMKVGEGWEKHSLDEKQRLQRDAGIPHLPTDQTYEARMALSGKGPRAFEWSDKKHRLVFDLCREIERIAALSTPREMTGFLATLTDDQKKRVLSYKGPENIGEKGEGDGDVVAWGLIDVVGRIVDANVLKSQFEYLNTPNRVVPLYLHPAPSHGMEGDGEVVERIAQRLFETYNNRLKGSYGMGWADIGGNVKERWRNEARNILASLHPAPSHKAVTVSEEMVEATDEMAILRRLADGDAIVYSQDGDDCWFSKGDRSHIAGKAVISLRAKGYIERCVDGDDQTDNYRGMAEYDGISSAGRAALAAISESEL